MQADEARYDRGLATMRKMFGPGIDSSLQSLETASPALARCLVEFPFAAVYARPGLNLKEREMLTVAALTVLGYPQAELKDHIRGTLNVGCTPDTIMEIILQMAVYAGFPAGLEAVKTAASIFEEANVSGHRTGSRRKSSKNQIDWSTYAVAGQHMLVRLGAGLPV